MTSTFWFEFIASFECKKLSITHTEMHWSWIYVLSAFIWKNQHNVKTVNVVARSFDRFVGQVCLEILRSRSESILMKVSEERRDLGKIRWSHFRDIQKSAKSPNFERSCTQTGGEKTGQFLTCFDTVFQRPYRYFSIALKVVFSLSDRYQIFTSNWLWIENCENVVLSKIDITMRTINKKTLKLIKA